MINKILAVLVALNLLATAGIGYAVVQMVDTGGKGGTTNLDVVSLTGALTIGADANGNGITFTPTRKTLTSATTTPCAILSPSSTSTIESVVFNITTATSTTGVFTLATSTTPYATTSLIATFTVTSGAQATLNWDGGNNNALVAPNTYIVFGVQGVPYGFTYGGTCSAVVRSVN
jgi:hypothetical protein